MAKRSSSKKSSNRSPSRAKALRAARTGEKKSGSDWMQPAYKQVNDPRWLENLLRRLNEVVGTASTVEIEKKTGVHRESVRRYVKHGPPSAEFVKAICDSYKVSADWLLLGRGKK